MRNRISGVIGVVLGGFILLNSFSGNATPVQGGTYGTGQMIGIGMGFLLFGAGLYYLTKGEGPTPSKKKKKPTAHRRPSPPPEL